MVDGTARLIEPPKGQAKLGVVFPLNSFSRPVPADGNYWVLDTDYINYSIVWNCQTFNGKSIRKFTFYFFVKFSYQLFDNYLVVIRVRYHLLYSFGHYVFSLYFFSRIV